MMAAIAPELADEVNEHGDVDKHNGDARCAGFHGDFVHLEWQQGAGDDDDHIFGPVFSPQKPDAFDDIERGVTQRRGAYNFQARGIDTRYGR